MRSPRAQRTSRLYEHALRRRFRRLLSSDSDGALRRMNHDGTIILNSDDLFQILPEYANNPKERPVLGPLLYSIARGFIDQTYRNLLSRELRRDETVVFTAGGSATGKSTILRVAGAKPGVDFVVDTTFSDTRRAFAQVDRALESGRKVAIYYVYADFRQSVRWMIRRALNPASGRLVPIDDMARTHFGAQRAILGASQKYQANEDVFIVLTENAGPSRLSILKEAEFERRLHDSIDGLRRLGQSVLDELYKGKGGKGSHGRQNQNSRRKSLQIPYALYQAARSKTQRAKPPSRKGNARRFAKGP
jgi:hypothetical protein